MAPHTAGPFSFAHIANMICFPSPQSLSQRTLRDQGENDHVQSEHAALQLQFRDLAESLPTHRALQRDSATTKTLAIAYLLSTDSPGRA